MTPQELINCIIEELDDTAVLQWSRVLDALCDGEALAAIGITDDDQEAVDAAASIVRESMADYPYVEQLRIEVESDAIEGAEFVEWLNAQGHDARLGRSTGGYINGRWTSTDDEASEIMNHLWSSYCSSCNA